MEVRFKATLYRGVISPLAGVAGQVAVGFARFKPDEIVDVTVARQTKRRTLPQNSRMWASLMSAFEELGWEKDEAKVWCCAKFLEPIVREFPDGTREETVRGTRHLTTAEMAAFQDRIERFLNERGLWFPTYGGNE